jgi:hypothetical protein
MAAKYILACLSVVFLVISTRRIVRDGGRVTPASRTWLTIGIIFALVSGYLWMTG